MEVDETSWEGIPMRIAWRCDWAANRCSSHSQFCAEPQSNFLFGLFKFQSAFELSSTWCFNDSTFIDILTFLLPHYLPQIALGDSSFPSHCLFNDFKLLWQSNRCFSFLHIECFSSPPLDESSTEMSRSKAVWALEDRKALERFNV